MKIKGWPWCAVCNKPAREVEVYTDPQAFELGDFVYVAYCHGNKEEHRLSLRLLAQAKEIRFTLAFSDWRPDRIPPCHEQLEDLR